MPRNSKKVPSRSDRGVRRRIPKWVLHAQTDALTNERYFLRSIGRAVDVLNAFDGERPQSLKELNAQTKLPESTLFRVLLTLERCGYLNQEVDGTYQLVPKLLAGWKMERANALRDKARPELERLFNKLNETASLAYLFDDGIHVLDCVESFHEIRISNKIGRVLPPHCSAMGKVIAAFQDGARIDRLLEVYGLIPRTEHTIIDRYRLFKEFETIRESGIGYDREESVVGGLCISAAIRPDGLPVLAAISVSTPLVRMNSAREQEARFAVRDAADCIAKGLVNNSP